MIEGLELVHLLDKYGLLGWGQLVIGACLMLAAAFLRVDPARKEKLIWHFANRPVDLERPLRIFLFLLGAAEILFLPKLW